MGGQVSTQTDDLDIERLATQVVGELNAEAPAPLPLPPPLPPPAASPVLRHHSRQLSAAPARKKPAERTSRRTVSATAPVTDHLSATATATAATPAASTSAAATGRLEIGDGRDSDRALKRHALQPSASASSLGAAGAASLPLPLRKLTPPSTEEPPPPVVTPRSAASMASSRRPALPLKVSAVPGAVVVKSAAAAAAAVPKEDSSEAGAGTPAATTGAQERNNGGGEGVVAVHTRQGSTTAAERLLGRERAGSLITVGLLKQYITQVGGRGTANAAILKREQTASGAVVERELADTECVPEDVDPECIVIRNSADTETCRHDIERLQQQQQQLQQQQQQTSQRATTTAAGVTPPVIPPPPLPPPAAGGGGKAPRVKCKPVPLGLLGRLSAAGKKRENSSESSNGSGAEVVSPRKMLKQKPPRCAMAYCDLQPNRPYRLQKEKKTADLTLVQVEHTSRQHEHSLWTLAIDPECTGMDLCATVLEMDRDVVLPGRAVPATLYSVSRAALTKDARAKRRTFAPDDPGVRAIPYDAKIVPLVRAWASPRENYFVVYDKDHSDAAPATAPAEPASAASQQQQQQHGGKAPIVVDVSLTEEQETASKTPCGHEDAINWIAEDDIQWLQKISSGAFARVYKGVYRNRVVAIKMLKGKLDAKMISEFQKEFRVFKAVHHPNIVECFGACYEQNRLSYVMEYCARGTLVHVMMDPNLVLTWENAADFFAQAVRGIHFLHCGGKNAIIHRDLKSQNLLVTRDYCIKVGDFGLSRFNTASNGTTLGTLCGTMSHCAPEVFTGVKFSTKSDVYSLGMVLWELAERVASGKYSAPFKEYPFITLDIQIIIQASQKHLRPTIHKDVPERFAALIRRCWDPDPDARPTTADLLAFIATCPQRRVGADKGTDPSSDDDSNSSSSGGGV